MITNVVDDQVISSTTRLGNPLTSNIVLTSSITSNISNAGVKGDKGDTGDQGIQGDAATVAVGTTTTGTPGSDAAVTNSGTANAAVFDFTIPKGDTGADGQVTSIVAGDNVTVDSTDPAHPVVSSSGSMEASVYDPAGKAEQLAADSEVVHLTGGTMTGPLVLPNGDSVAPALEFIAGSDEGLYHATSVITIAAQAVIALAASTSGAQIHRFGINGSTSIANGAGSVKRTGFAGVTIPTAKIHIAAGESTASGSPLKLTAGTNLATPETGAIEYDGTHLYVTDSTGTRHQLDQQAGDGDVGGPASATDNAVARFDSTSGKLIQNSGATIDDSGNITATNLSGTNTGDQDLSGYAQVVQNVSTEEAEVTVTQNPAWGTKSVVYASNGITTTNTADFLISSGGNVAITADQLTLDVSGASFSTGADVVGTSTTQTLTGKRITSRVSSATTASVLTPDVSSYDQYNFTALAEDVTINAPTGTPTDGQKLMFRLKDTGTSRVLLWNAIFRSLGVDTPGATTASKTTYVGCIYNSADTKWDVIAVTTEA
jgi:hypothetical protein